MPKMFKSRSFWIENCGITFIKHKSHIADVIQTLTFGSSFYSKYFDIKFFPTNFVHINLCLALLIYESKCTNSIKFSSISHNHFNEVLMHQTVSSYIEKETKKQCTLVHIGTELSVMKRENLSCTAFFFRVFKWACLCMLMFCTENMVWCSEQFFQWYVCCICSLHVYLQVRAWRRMIVCVFWHEFSNRHHKRALVHHLFAVGMEKKTPTREAYQQWIKVSTTCKTN